MAASKLFGRGGPIAAEAYYRPHRLHPELFLQPVPNSSLVVDDTFDNNTNNSNSGNDHVTIPKSWIHTDLLDLVTRFESYYESNIDNNIHPSPPPKTQLDLDNKQQLHELFPNLRIESSGVYSFNCFSTEFLDMFNSELDHFYNVVPSHLIRRPNSMNNYGVILNEIGLQTTISTFQQQYVWPIARVVFPIEGQQFDDHHSFIVRYQANEDLGLDMHTDDSDVTFNVCLGSPGFVGATLEFCGIFATSSHRQHRFTYQHEIGRAILHLGSQRHGADDIQSGTRSNMIIWNHNWSYRSSPIYKAKMTAQIYEQEQHPPSLKCLSYTHDRDYSNFKDIPPSIKNKVGRNGKSLTDHQWCPPPGKEYEGFQMSTTTSDQDDGVVPDEDL